MVALQAVVAKGISCARQAAESLQSAEIKGALRDKQNKCSKSRD